MASGTQDGNMNKEINMNVVIDYNRKVYPEIAVGLCIFKGESPKTKGLLKFPLLDNNLVKDDSPNQVDKIKQEIVHSQISSSRHHKRRAREADPNFLSSHGSTKGRPFMGVKRFSTKYIIRTDAENDDDITRACSFEHLDSMLLLFEKQIPILKDIVQLFYYLPPLNHSNVLSAKKSPPIDLHVSHDREKAPGRLVVTLDSYGLEKRQCTVQLTIFIDGEPRIKPYFPFSIHVYEDVKHVGPDTFKGVHYATSEEDNLKRRDNFPGHLRQPKLLKWRPPPVNSMGEVEILKTIGTLVKRGSLFDALRSVDTGHCCPKHSLMSIYPQASTRGVNATSSCSDLKHMTSKRKVYVKSPGSNEYTSTSRDHAGNEDAMMSRRAQPTAVSHNTGLNQPRPPLAIQAHPAYQHPIIRDVTPLLHASAFSKITQRVEPMLQQVFQAEVKVPLYFVAGLAFFKCGKYNDAKTRLNTCIELCVPMGTKANGDMSLCNVYLGDTEFNSRHFMVAAEHYQKAAAMYSAVNVAALFRMVPPSLSAIHAKCGSALRNASKMVDGVQEYKIAINKALTDKDKLAANTSLGNLYQSLGENTSALTHYELSVLLSEKLGDFISLGWAHGNMGNAYLGLFQKDKALYHLQKSLDLTVEHEPTPQAIGRTYNNLGTAYQSLNELDKAQEHYDLALSQAIYGNDIPGQARVYGNIGNVFMLRKKYGEAIPHYGEVLRLSKDRSTLSTAHHNRGCAYYEWAETKMDDLSKPGPKTEAEVQSKSGVVLPQSVEPTATDAKFYVHGLDFTDIKAHTYPRRVIDSIAKYYRLGSDDLQEVVKYHEENLDNIKGSAKGLSLSISLFETNSRSFHRYQDCLVNLGKYDQALLVAEQSRARTLGELMLKRKGWSLPLPLDSPLPFDQIVTMISSRPHPVLYLSYTGARLLGWVFVPKDGNVKMNMFEVPLSDDQFDGKSFDYHLRYTLTEALVERSFEMYRGVTYDEESSKPVENLYNLIAKPLLCILEKHTDLAQVHKIVVISDSYTALLPYSSLRDPKESGFLGDKISFQLMPSLLTMGVLDQLPDANVVRLPSDTQNMCIAGNPTIPMFNYKNEVWNLGKLPHAKREAEWVSHILKTTPILNEQATKSAILMRIMSAKVIHLATHGSASAGFLAFGAMVSGPRDMTVHSSSVLLYPEEVEKLNISPALVVLSSCDSGRGAVKADGIQGMARAFILAGAQAVLTTLWRVPDESAAVFMQFFYQYMMDGMESTLALRKAILSIRCFSKYSQYIHWSGYQLTGRDVWFQSSTPSSTQVLIQRLGPGSVFPRLAVLKTLEAALINDPCPPTDVQILQGCPGVKPCEIVVDFIHNSQQHFRGGVFWINCTSQEFLSDSICCIEKEMDVSLAKLNVTETSPALFVFDGMTVLPNSEPLLLLMKNRHAHLVVLYKHYQSPDKLIRTIDHKLLRGCKVHTVAPLTNIDSTQRMVYAIQRETDLAPNNEDQEILEQLAEFTCGSPVLVDITSQLILSQLKDTDDVCAKEPSHSTLHFFSGSFSLKETRQTRVDNSYFVMRDISHHMKKSVPSVFTLTQEQRDEWDTTSKYDSWDSTFDLIATSELCLEEEILLNCLSIFGSNPIPVALTTCLSSLISKTSGRPHLATSLLQNLVKKSFIQTYPLPVVIHPSIKSSSSAGGPDFVHVPQCIANFLWKSVDASDKAISLATSYYALSSLSTQPSAQRPPFLLGLVSLLQDCYELNLDLMGEACYKEVYKLYLTLAN